MQTDEELITERIERLIAACANTLKASPPASGLYSFMAARST
jgi:hypothetical protein